MNIVPYASPLLPQFRSKAFRAETLRAKASLEAVFFDDARFVKGLQSPWTSFVPKQRAVSPAEKATAARQAGWVPKLYVCVGASQYWKVVRRLVDSLKGTTHWKFYMAPDGYDRPDKIVVYARSARHLGEVVRKVRPLLPKHGFHKLHHTASTAELGLEGARNHGLFVGIDPPFRESWRIYRSFCIAWADWNADYLAGRPGGRARWFERMNLSDKHQGPRSLEPPFSDLAHAKRYWKHIKP